MELPFNALPQDVHQVSVTAYPAAKVSTFRPGSTAAKQDLLTGGLGKSGLMASTTPDLVHAGKPSADELRRNAIHSNYRGMVEVSNLGDYGVFYGPNVKADGTVGTDEGLVPGVEYVATLDDGSGRKQAVMAVQIPNAFDVNKPCIVVAPSSGSRGVYGAIGTAGEWGLKRGCAVALTDAGKGVGVHDLWNDTVNKVDGTVVARKDAGTLAQFAADVSDAALAAYNAVFGYTFALKHAHSQRNPEKDWGTDTLAAARYAFYAINDRFGKPDERVRFHPANTVVIAASFSTGATAALRAAEQDSTGLIDGVVAAVPVTQLPTTAGYGIEMGGTPVAAYGKRLVDTLTWANIYAPCAQLVNAATLDFGELNTMNLQGMNGGRAQARCASLAAKGLVSGATVDEQAADAMRKLHAYGFAPEQDLLHNAMWGMGFVPGMAAVYTNAYGRFSVLDHVCGVTFAQRFTGFLPVGDDPGATGVPAPADLASRFALFDGTPANGLFTVFYDSWLGPRSFDWAYSTSTRTRDLGLDAALCQRALVTGRDAVTGAALTASSTPTAAQASAVQAGIAEVLASGDLHGKPALVLGGRSDAIAPVDQNARAYAAFNRSVEGARSQLRYIEVTNAQHFDGLDASRGFDVHFVPMRVYFDRAMDRMLAHLLEGAPLPPDQVVRTATLPGPGGLPQRARLPSDLPPISAAPAAADAIAYAGATLKVPR